MMKDFGRWFEETAEYLRAEESPKECETCEGEGTVGETLEHFGTPVTRKEACLTCGGEGTIDERLGGEAFSNSAAACPDCQGSGEVETSAYYTGECLRCGGLGFCIIDEATGIGPEGVSTAALAVDCPVCSPKNYCYEIRPNSVDLTATECAQSEKYDGIRPSSMDWIKRQFKPRFGPENEDK